MKYDFSASIAKFKAGDSVGIEVSQGNDVANSWTGTAIFEYDTLNGDTFSS